MKNAHTGVIMFAELEIPDPEKVRDHVLDRITFCIPLQSFILVHRGCRACCLSVSYFPFAQMVSSARQLPDFRTASSLQLLAPSYFPSHFPHLLTCPCHLIYLLP